MRFRQLLFILVAACLLTSPINGQNTWPFGTGDRGFTRIDAWNLGIIGAKAIDASKDLPKRPEMGRRQVTQMGPRDRSDAGPERLRVLMLFPDGPAHKAGLRIDDVIVGVNGKKFTKGSLTPLAKALASAESSKGKLTLDVLRDGKKQKVEIKVTKNKDLRKFTTGKGRRAIRDAALEFLASRQKEDGGFQQTLSGTNGAVVQTSIAGLAWLGGGSDLQGGKYQDNVKRASQFVMRYVDEADDMVGGRGGSNWNQSNWGYVHAAIFLGELQVRSPSGAVKKQLEHIVAEIQKRQEKSGGYAHGPGGPNALNYLELNIVTGLALSGLGCAAKAGIPVDRKLVKHALAYLEDGASGDGGVAYSSKDGQKGQGNIGRTAATWLGMRNLGFGKSSFGQKTGKYVARHVGDVQDGHASLMQHIFLAGVAAQAQSKSSQKRFWDALKRDLTLGRAPDGSIQPRPWHESLSMSSNSDVTFGEIWTTAAWAVILGADPKENPKGGLPVWLGKTKLGS